MKMPIVTANKSRIPLLLGFCLCIIGLSASGCGGKDKKIKVPPNILNAKTAAYDELLNLVENYKNINELSSNHLKLTLVYNKMESGTQKKFPKVSGYIMLKRPDSIHMVLKKGLVGTVLDMLSTGDILSAWIPDKNKFYIGKNSAKELFADDLPEGFAMRGTHLFEAVFPHKIQMNSPGTRISKEEAIDDTSKYYIISVYKDEGSRRIRVMRKIWIERSQLAIVRQQFFLEDGQVESDIQYSDLEDVDGFNLPLKIHMERPLDGYAVTLEFQKKSWRINSGLGDKVFVLDPPEGAEIVHLKERVTDGDF